MKLYKPTMEMKSVGTWRLSSILTTALLYSSFCTKVYVIPILQDITYKHTYMCTCVHLWSFIHTQRRGQTQSVGIIFQMLEDKDSAFWWWGCGRGCRRNAPWLRTIFILPEVLNSVSTTYIRGFTISCSLLPSPCRNLHTVGIFSHRPCTHTHK